MLLTEPLQPTLISRERDRSGFLLDQLPNATCVLFEEPCIDKTIMRTNTDMKHQAKEITERLPIFITTNQELWAWCESSEKAPLEIRIKNTTSQILLNIATPAEHHNHHTI
ncbi:hypothetical protein PR048_022975 [Dryococelus australis]|uniref:Uncharacterized protein n=1 Tax=Dryococelus australis TaxID=614101 RepID=A0ABQ9GSV9_9NEOP|nr:hypothetical protein PR048_022975 [Dryococelus australis]